MIRAATKTELTPSSSRRVIRRPRLLRLLDESPSRIVMLVAPAGYGKTTLANQWIGEHTYRATWYPATSAAGDVAAIASGIATAAAGLVSEAGAAMRSRLRVSHSPADEARVLAELLAADLQRWPRDAWLIIDDYQFASDVPAAEAFVETLLFGAPLNVLLISRKRPRWATSRRLLYGEVYEVGRSLLAMDSDEADAVLSEGAATSMPGLLALADGWPAIIGLAGLTRIDRLPESQVPEQLFDFFAQELYRALTPEAQDGLGLIAVVPRVDHAVATALLGSHASRVLSECWDAGLVTKRPGEVYEVHPLVRSFLEREEPAAKKLPVELIQLLVDIYIERSNWDDALALTRHTSRDEILERVVTAVLDPLMNEGRLQTLDEVIADTRRRKDSAPIFDLVEAEVAFRRARYDQSEVLASRAARLFPEHSTSRSRAYFRAGHASFFADRTHQALEYAELSRGAASNATDLTNALWLQFVGMTELELPESHKVLEQLGAAASDQAHDIVRVTTGRLIIADRWGRVTDSLLAAEAVYWLLPRVADPMIRTSFYNMFGRVLIASGNYSRALEVSQQGIDEIETARLDFALPHMLMPKSSAELGLGQIALALETADQAILLAKDLHARANCALLRARALIASRDFKGARRCLADSTMAKLDPATRGEVLAHDALAAACRGDVGGAEARVAEAGKASSTVHTAIVALLTRTLVSPLGTTRLTFMQDALRLVSQTEHVDYIVLAARASDDLHRVLHNSSLVADSVIERARRLLQQPVVLGRTEDAHNELTRRESEVLECVSLGLSNREIAKRLYISEVTVKVHVRHILAKLGARSRTEAAVLHMKRTTGSTRPAL